MFHEMALKMHFMKYSERKFSQRILTFIYIQSNLICIQSHLIYIQSHLILFSLLFCIQSHIPCGRTLKRKYNHAADLEIIKLN